MIYKVMGNKELFKSKKELAGYFEKLKPDYNFVMIRGYFYICLKSYEKEVEPYIKDLSINDYDYSRLPSKDLVDKEVLRKLQLIFSVEDGFEVKQLSLSDIERENLFVKNWSADNLIRLEKDFLELENKKRSISAWEKLDMFEQEMDRIAEMEKLDIDAKEFNRRVEEEALKAVEELNKLFEEKDLSANIFATENYQRIVSERKVKVDDIRISKEQRKFEAKKKALDQKIREVLEG